MFRSRNDALARQVDFETEVWDFFDLSSLWEKQEKVLGSGMVGTGALILGGRALGGISWLDSTLTAAKIVGPNNMRRLLLPGLITAAATGVSVFFCLPTGFFKVKAIFIPCVAFIVATSTTGHDRLPHPTPQPYDPHLYWTFPKENKGVHNQSQDL